jgi:electron transport complex protein RnfD
MQMYTVSSSPHIVSRQSTPRIMLDVCIALVPAGVVAALVFGPRALWIVALSVAAAVGTEALIQKLAKKPVTIHDFSAVVTGILLAYNVPPAVPWWLPVIGSVVAIGLAKQAFGGLGRNFMNPALAARAILMAAWPSQMTGYVLPGTYAFTLFDPKPMADAVTSATPLAIMKGTEATGALPSLRDMILGNIGGCIGEISAAALLLGAAYLLIRKVITWHTPVAFIGTVALMTWILGGHDGLFTGDWIYHIFAGGLMIGAFFMATDYSSSPMTRKGQFIMGVGCGLITSVIRLYGGYPEGVSYSILLMNIATPLIDKYIRPKRYGEVRADEKCA